MSRRIGTAFAGAAFALFAGFGTAALAHPHSFPGMEAAERAHRDVFIHRGGERRDRAEHLRAILQLRPNQEAALQAYVEATKPKDATVERFGVQDRGETTTQRLARMEQRLNEQQARARTTIDATRRFYDQLDASQKRAFDELPMMMLPGGRMEVLPISTAHIRQQVMKGLEGLDRLEWFGQPPTPPTPPAPPPPPAPPRV